MMGMTNPSVLKLLLFQCASGFVWDRANVMGMTCPSCKKKTCFMCKKKVKFILYFFVYVNR